MPDRNRPKSKEGDVFNTILAAAGMSLVKVIKAHEDRLLEDQLTITLSYWMRPVSRLALFAD